MIQRHHSSSRFRGYKRKKKGAQTAANRGGSAVLRENLKFGQNTQKKTDAKKVAKKSELPPPRLASHDTQLEQRQIGLARHGRVDYPHMTKMLSMR